MRSLAALLLAGAAFAQEHAFVEVATTPEFTRYVGERVPLWLRFGYDREHFRAHAVPLLPRRTDVLLHVRAEVPGEPFDARAPRGPTFALNDDVVEAEPLADEVRDGRTFAVLAWRRVFTPTRAGEVVIPSPTLRYVHATVFEEDFVAGRIARDPKDVVITGAPLVLRILPLPEDGRPAGFNGAVGRFTIAASCGTASVDVGEIFELTVSLEGNGNATLPRIDLPGFHVFGTVLKDGGRTAVLDVAALRADVAAVPAIPFAFFDPGPPAGYRVVRTDRVPLAVRAPAREAPPPPPVTEEDGTSAVVIAVAATLVALAALVAWARRRAARAPLDPEAERLREALATARARAARGGGDAAAVLADLLAVCLRCPPAAVIGPDLAARLEARGFPPDLARRTAGTLERMVAARYGATSGGSGGDVEALLAEIEPWIRAEGGGA